MQERADKYLRLTREWAFERERSDIGLIRIERKTWKALKMQARDMRNAKPVLIPCIRKYSLSDQSLRAPPAAAVYEAGHGRSPEIRKGASNPAPESWPGSSKKSALEKFIDYTV